MFQYWRTKTLPLFGYLSDGEMVEDTDLITFKKAVELWNKYKLDAIRQIEDGQNVEMCIWTGCEKNTDYTTPAFHIDNHTEIDGYDFVEVVKKKIDPNHTTMGEPVFVTPTPLSKQEEKK
jgi:hypothetical protein